VRRPWPSSAGEIRGEPTTQTGAPFAPSRCTDPLRSRGLSVPRRLNHVCRHPAAVFCFQRSLKTNFRGHQVFSRGFWVSSSRSDNR